MKEVDNLTDLIKMLIRKLQIEWSNNWSGEASSEAGKTRCEKDKCEGTKRDFKELYRERRI